MISVPIVDSHVHFWQPAQLTYAWLEDVPPLNRSFLPEDHAADCGEQEIEKIVFVQCEGEPYLAEPDWVASLAEQDSRIQAIVAKAPVENGRAVCSDLEKLAANPLVRGVRRLIQEEPDDDFCSQPKFVEGVQSLTEFGLSFDLCIYHRQLASVLKLVKQCPEVQFVLDHIGKPGIKDGIIDPWKKQLTELAAFPNVQCKLSGMVTEADHDAWTEEQLRPYLAHAIDCFGFDRIMYGSDWPVIRLASTVGRWLNLVWSEVEHCTSEEQAKLFSGNANAFYRLV